MTHLFNSQPSGPMGQASSQSSGITRRFLAPRRSNPGKQNAGTQVAVSVNGSAATPPGTNRDTLISVFLHGGMDGLTAVVPFGDVDPGTGGRWLDFHRPTLAIPSPGQPNGAVDLDGFFGLAPAAAPLATPFQAGDLAIVHGVGSPDPTRSHFSATRMIQAANPNMPGTQLTSGWLARHLSTIAAVGAGDLRAVSQDHIMPQILAEGPGALAIKDPTDFTFPGDPATAMVRRSLIENMYQGAMAPMAAATVSSLAAIDLLATVDFAGYVPSNGAVYPNTNFGGALKNMAIMIKAGMGLEVAHVNFHGWDHHSLMGPLTGMLASMLDDLSRSMEALYLDMLGDSNGYTLVLQSEFGRRVSENGSAGLDHGHGNAMFVMGENVNGGQVYGTWPGLAPTSLDSGDLAVTTDYRDVMAEVLAVRLGSTQLGAVFPNFSPTFLGLVN